MTIAEIKKMLGGAEYDFLRNNEHLKIQEFVMSVNEKIVKGAL